MGSRYPKKQTDDGRIRKRPIKRMTIPKSLQGYVRYGGKFRFASKYDRSKSVELKYFDTTLSGTLDTTGEVLGSPTGLCLIAAGTGESHRIVS